MQVTEKKSVQGLAEIISPSPNQADARIIKSLKTIKHPVTLTKKDRKERKNTAGNQPKETKRRRNKAENTKIKKPSPLEASLKTIRSTALSTH